MPKFAISDIHGCTKTFDALLNKLQFSTRDELYLLGDYIDRGANSKGVIDLIWDLQKEGYTIHCLRGNHEQMLLDALRGDLGSEELWMFNGGVETLQSFGLDTVRDIPLAYIDFFENCHYFLEVDEYILVHAGLNFEHHEPLDNKHSMLWIRRWYEQIDFDWLGNRIIVHGHTPKSSSKIRHLHHNLKNGQVLNIDAGCVFGRRRVDLGQLCAFDMTNRELFFQKSVE